MIRKLTTVDVAQFLQIRGQIGAIDVKPGRLDAPDHKPQLLVQARRRDGLLRDSQLRHAHAVLLTRERDCRLHQKASEAAATVLPERYMFLKL